MALIAITPQSSMDAGKIKQIRDVAAKVAQDNVRAATDVNLTVRPLTPTDFYGATTAQFSNQAALSANPGPTADTGIAKVPNQTAWVLYGFGRLTSNPSIVELWVADGAATYAKIRLQPLDVGGPGNNGTQVRIGYFNPLYFPANAQVVLNYIYSANVSAKAETFELLGIVAEIPNNVRNQEPIASSQPSNVVAG